MTNSRLISERHWNLSDKGERENKREEMFIDDIIQKAHIEREILSNLDGIKTVFDGGAGAGRFSIMLAKKGIRVTHFDISEPMIKKAKELARQAGVEDKLTFIKGALEDLDQFDDHAFDMVISFDAPISYTYPNQEKVIENLVRIGKKKIIISVSSRLGTLPYFTNPIQKSQFIIDRDSEDNFVRWCVDHEASQIDNFKYNKDFVDMVYREGLCDDLDNTIEAFNEGKSPWPITYLFMPDELEDLLDKNGVENIRLAGPGAYARTIPREILMKLIHDENQKRDFLDFCYRYDNNKYVCGMGKDNLLAVGDLRESTVK
ncbi:methyltransferase domain-containing protein [Acidaminobacter sp. JC074]|uniref:methyltransferase domain-containing protein n=1 Tax=Acidaminobacter sp. JC074 TaxID=2530199 RepID=UPI001F10E9A6|nr:methyltransferase domain-containing protein [Acidaminobacter sp. JC074]MCH4886759.1 methyltransferase domain-containing protein [Acidaminobacter sp. JC074]